MKTTKHHQARGNPGQLDRERAWLASFSEGNPNPIIEIDPAGTITYMNPAAQEKFSDLSERGLDHSLLDGIEPIFSPKGQKKTLPFKREVRWGETIFEQEIHAIPAMGVIRIYMTDITERKRLEELKDEFIGTVSHELRTPLSIIKGAIGNLRDGIVGLLTPEQQKLADLTSRNIERLSRIISAILDLSRLEAEQGAIIPRAVEMGPLLHEVLAHFQLMARERGLKLQAEIPADLPLVAADPDLVHQLLTNLLDNALRFARAVVRVEVAVIEVRNESALDTFVQTAVVDDGCGIPLADQGRLFSKFQQLHRAEGAGYKGTGLGLAICRRIVERFGGQIWLESHPDEGAQFFFTLRSVDGVGKKAGAHR